jgi:RNA polymerase sigma-70 factor, ECF subfamily
VPDAGLSDDGLSDDVLVERFRSGDKASFDLLVERHQQPIFYLSLRYLKNEADAQDVAQRAFVQAFQSLGGFRRQASFRTWVYRITVNLCLNAIRDRARMRVEETGEAVVSSPDAPEHEAQRRLRQAIELLPPMQRKVVELKISTDLPFKEIGRMAACSEDSAKMNYHHALRRLRELMGAGETS